MEKIFVFDKKKRVALLSKQLYLLLEQCTTLEAYNTTSQSNTMLWQIEYCFRKMATQRKIGKFKYLLIKQLPP